MNFFKEIWLKNRSFIVAITGEALRFFCVIAVLFAADRALEYMRVKGFDPDEVHFLQRLDFAIMVCALVINGWFFLGMLITAHREEHKR